MKKLPFLILMLVAFESSSQTYQPFPDSNIVWVQRDWWTDFATFPPCVITNDYELFISGDTVIGSYTYHKLYSNGQIYATCPPPGWYYSGAYWGAFRQDTLNKKVYLYKNGVDTLAYDFNFNAGDTLPATCLSFGGDNYAQSVDSVLIGTQYHKRFLLNFLNWPFVNNYAEMIEGIGTWMGAFSPMYPPFESGFDLFCVYINNQIVWTNPLYNMCPLISVNENKKSENDISISPNPFQTSATLQTSNEFANSELIIFNTLGRKVKQQNIKDRTTIINRDGLFAGIYFFQIRNAKGQTAAGKIIVE